MSTPNDGAPAILDALRYPSTVEQLASKLGKSHSTVRRRLREIPDREIVIFYTKPRRFQSSTGKKNDSYISAQHAAMGHPTFTGPF